MADREPYIYQFDSVFWLTISGSLFAFLAVAIKACLKSKCTQIKFLGLSVFVNLPPKKMTWRISSCSFLRCLQDEGNSSLRMSIISFTRFFSSRAISRTFSFILSTAMRRCLCIFSNFMSIGFVVIASILYL